MVPKLIHSFMISQIFGVYMLLMAIVLLGKANYIRSIYAKANSDDIAFYLHSTAGLLLGIFLVDLHNAWIWSPRILVTLLGWVILVKSLLWLAFPVGMLRWSKKMVAGKIYYFIVFIIALWGILLLARGSFLNLYFQLTQVIQ